MFESHKKDPEDWEMRSTYVKRKIMGNLKNYCGMLLFKCKIKSFINRIVFGYEKQMCFENPKRENNG